MKKREFKNRGLGWECNDRIAERYKSRCKTTNVKIKQSVNSFGAFFHQFRLYFLFETNAKPGRARGNLNVCADGYIRECVSLRVREAYLRIKTLSLEWGKKIPSIDHSVDAQRAWIKRLRFAACAQT